MTRKELCESLGISIKTLRIYEEKRLITPKKEMRNGREYREYSPELVEDLRDILTLRRARFTMDEILTMQSAPEKIPEIFRAYSLWLRQETDQLLQLRSAAEGIQADSLTGLGDLIAQLESTARDIPLPQMDIRPRFRHLDEMEEPPRQVVEQTNLDEMIPDERVFRQVNLVMDRDRGNNKAIIIGQMRDMKRERWDTGPVQRKSRDPRWYRVLSGILSLLLVGQFLLTLSQRWNRQFWYVFFVLAVARILWAGIPVVVDHRRWLKDYTRPDPEEVTQCRQRRKRLVLLGCLILAVSIGVGCGLYRIIDSQVNPAADVRIRFYAQGYLTEKEVYTMGQSLSTLVEDLDGNGKTCGVVEFFQVTPDKWVMGEKIQYKVPQYIQNGMETGEIALFFLDNREYQGYGELTLCQDYRFSRYCRTLPEDLQTEDNPYCADVTGTELFRCIGQEDWPVYACISDAVSEEEYEAAVELLRNMTR